MPKVLFSISYGIRPEVRQEYLRLIRELKLRVRDVGGKNYSVFETKGKKNQFMEVFLSETLEEHEALEDNQDETTQDIVRQLEKCVDEGGMKYSTLIELE